MTQEIKFDDLSPAEIAVKAEAAGIKKTNLSIINTFFLAVLAGAYIALGAIFATIVATGSSGIIPYGINRLLMGVVFSLGLILVVVAGAELFTGNNLLIIAWLSKKISISSLFSNWIIVYLGNFIGSFCTAILIFLSKQYLFADGAIGKTILTIANNKVHLGFIQAVCLGILCNALVCLAVWMSMGSRSIAGKILSIVFPISAFVAAGFEHSVANMYFIPVGLLIKLFDPVFINSTQLDVNDLTWINFLLKNLLPVTIGNIIGGAVMVGMIYWFIYQRSQKEVK